MINTRGSLILYILAVGVIVIIAGSAWYMKSKSNLTAAQPTAQSINQATLPNPAIKNPDNSEDEVNVEDDFKGVDADLQSL